MDLFLLRHGIAEERSGAKSDDDRRLTAEGVDKMNRIVRALKQLEIEFDAILSSPLPRALETARIVASALGAGGGPEIEKCLMPGGDLQQLFEHIRKRFKECRRILLVGHEPDLGQMAAKLISVDGSAAVRFKKGGVCKLRMESASSNRAILEWLLTPTQLLKIR